MGAVDTEPTEVWVNPLRLLIRQQERRNTAGSVLYLAVLR